MESRLQKLKKNQGNQIRKTKNWDISVKYKCGHREKKPHFIKFNIDLVFFLHWKNKTGFDGSKRECFGCFLDKSLRTDYIPTLLNSQQKKNGFSINSSIKLVKLGNWGEEIKGWKSNNARFRIFLREKCEICSKKDNLTIHHIISRYNGGLDIWWNCQTLCCDCHNRLEIIIKKKMKKEKNGEKK